MPYTEKTEISKPLDWLNEESWNYLADYCDSEEYAYYDDMYSYIMGDISLKDYISRGHESATIEEVLEKYNKEFPKIMARGLKDIADDILTDNLIIKFIPELT